MAMAEALDTATVRRWRCEPIRFIEQVLRNPETDRIPAQRNRFGWAQAMPVSHQDHGRVAMAITVVARCCDQLFDL
jgi:hypothetical protein